MNIKKYVYVLFLLLISGILVACGGEDGSDEAGGETDAVQEGGTLDFAFQAQPVSMDIHTTTDVATRDISLHIYESLLTFDSGLEIQPMLAESYEIEDNGDIVFTLREGVEFHNGKEMTAEDVVASMERWQEISSDAQTYLAGTEYVAEDDYTVIAQIEDPSTLDIYTLANDAQIMPREIVEGAGAESVDEYIGTGPLQFEEWRQDQYIHLTKFENYQSRSEPADGYAGEKNVTYDEVYFHIVTDPSTRIAGLQTGDYDIAGSVPQDNARTLEDDPNINNHIFETSFPTLIFNKNAGFSADETARQAVNAAIDVEAMLVAAYESDDYFSLDHAIVREDQEDWYTDVGSETYSTFDTEKAIELLEEVGYDGEEIVIRASRERLDRYNMSIVAQQNLEDAGMNVRLEASDWGTVLESLEDDDAWDMYITSFSFIPMPALLLPLNPEWTGGTDSDELAHIIDDILYADNPEEAHQFSDALHEEFWKYLPGVKIGNGTAVVSTGSGVDGLQYVMGPVVWNVTMEE